VLCSTSLGSRIGSLAVLGGFSSEAYRPSGHGSLAPLRNARQRLSRAKPSLTLFVDLHGAAFPGHVEIAVVAGVHSHHGWHHGWRTGTVTWRVGQV